MNDIDFRRIRDEVITSIDSLHTIVSCSLHQKRVIDDVLTLSKLDSNLILITPVRVQSAVVVSEALKMFDVECSQMDIKLEFCRDPTFEGYDWVMLDPSRLLQVLINLLLVIAVFPLSSANRLQNQRNQIYQGSSCPKNHSCPRSIPNTSAQSVGLCYLHLSRRDAAKPDYGTRMGQWRARVPVA